VTMFEVATMLRTSSRLVAPASLALATNKAEILPDSRSCLSRCCLKLPEWLYVLEKITCTCLKTWFQVDIKQHLYDEVCIRKSGSTKADDCILTSNIKVIRLESQSKRYRYRAILAP